MSIRSKLFLAFSIVLSLAVSIAAYGVHAIANAENLVVQLYDQPFMAVSYARAAQAKFSDARAAMERGMRDNTFGSNDAVFTAAMNDVVQDLAIVGKRTTDTDHLKKIGNAQQLAQDWYRTASRITKQSADGLSTPPLPTDALHLADKVAEAIDHVVEDASEYGFKFRSLAKGKVAASQVSLISLAIATVVVGILFSLGISFSFGRALRNAMAISERIAAGNLSEKVSTTRRDELGRLLVSLGQTQEVLRTQAQDQRLAAEAKDRDHADQIARRQRMEQQIADFRGSIGKMLNQAQEMTGRMNLTAQTLSIISAEADLQAKEAAHGAEETSSNVASVAASTNELDASIREITGRIASASDVVNGATELADATAKMISRLVESTKRIDDVVGLIRSVAERTNLLALNATIEAARAGDAGRGFAIVASEVKALATQTAKATQEISGQITDVHSSTSRAVEGIRSIVGVMAEINNTTADIAGAVQQQGTATEEIARNIQGVADATHNVARSVVGTTSSISDTNRAAAEVLVTAEYLTSHSAELRASVDGFLRDVAAA